MSIDFPKEEERVLARWKEIDAFLRQVELVRVDSLKHENLRSKGHWKSPQPMSSTTAWLTGVWTVERKTAVHLL